MDEAQGQIYEHELFERLNKSAELKRGEESFACYLKPALWWIIDKPSPKPHDIEKAVSSNCAICLKKLKSGKNVQCIKSLLESIRSAAEIKKIIKFECKEGLRGFVYPIIQGDKHYGYIGSCYAKKDVPAPILDILTSYIDTIVKEVQRELELSKLYETIRPRAIALSTVHTVHRLIGSTLNLHELLPRIARLSLQIMRANRCSIKLVDAKKKTLLPKATIDLREKHTQLKKVKVGKYAPGKAVKFGRPIRGDDFIATPLIDEDIIGVITLYDKIDRKPFTAFDQEIMSTLAEQAVIAIKNAQLYKEQERLTIGSIKSLAAVLETRAPGTYVPKASFIRIAVTIGQEMHMATEDLKSLEYAAILHDAGEIFVPETVLSKPSKLTGKEYDMVKEHPAAGVSIIKHIKALKTVVPIILYHHENFDGSGYPKGLKKDQIPLGARIMAVVSAFEAMIAGRPYRKPMPVDDATGEIGKNSGGQFDPVIVDILFRVVRRKDIRAMLDKERQSELMLNSKCNT